MNLFYKSYNLMIDSLETSPGLEAIFELIIKFRFL